MLTSYFQFLPAVREGPSTGIAHAIEPAHRAVDFDPDRLGGSMKSRHSRDVLDCSGSSRRPLLRALEQGCLPLVIRQETRLQFPYVLPLIHPYEAERKTVRAILPSLLFRTTQLATA